MNVQYAMKVVVIGFLILQSIAILYLLRRSNILSDNRRSTNVPKQDDRFKENYFDVVKSDSIPLDRKLSDVRSSSCSHEYEGIDELDTSIIIVFHNEAKSTFYRTLTSIVNRTPHHLIKEILLVNDCSQNRDYLSRQSITEFTSKLPIPTSLVECTERQGLIRARMIGVRNAKGKTLTFLDSHVEVTVGWLEPLLYEILQKNSTVACPIIDVINARTFEYESTVDNLWGGFDLGLGFQWFFMNRKNQFGLINKIVTPVMAGGLYTINAEYFKGLGGYDEQMNIWGFENIEMSIRTWTCGGSIVLCKCSHVAHVFRDHSPYTFPKGVSQTINTNLKRTVDVWLDEYKEILYRTKLNNIHFTQHHLDIQERMNLRKELHCKSFKWYLINVYPESMFPVNSQFYGTIANKALKQCLRAENLLSQSSTELTFRDCSPEGNQLFQITDQSNLRVGFHCLHIVDQRARLQYCYKNMPFTSEQIWKYNEKTQLLEYVKTGQCLNSKLEIDECLNDPDHRWTLREFSLKSTKF